MCVYPSGLIPRFLCLSLLSPTSQLANVLEIDLDLVKVGIHLQNVQVRQHIAVHTQQEKQEVWGT